jgi:hypothetical protein
LPSAGKEGGELAGSGWNASKTASTSRAAVSTHSHVAVPSWPVLAPHFGHCCSPIVVPLSGMDGGERAVERLRCLVVSVALGIRSRIGIVLALERFRGVSVPYVPRM